MNSILNTMDLFVTPVGDDVLRIATNHTGAARVAKRDSKGRSTALMTARPDQSGKDDGGLYVIQAPRRYALNGTGDLAQVISAICSWGVRRDVLIGHMARRAVRSYTLVDLVRALPDDRDALLSAARAALMKGGYYHLGQDLKDGMDRADAPAAYLQDVARAQSRVALNVADAVVA